FFSSRRRHTRFDCDWSSDVCSSDLHPYTQVIQVVFNQHWFGPSPGVTQVSSCPCVDHPASRVLPATRRPIQTRFRYGCAKCFTLPLRVTSRLIMQKARGCTFRLAPA